MDQVSVQRTDVDAEPTAALVDHLQRALTSRADIDQAKGILIALHRISGDDAWQLLNRASQTLGAQCARRSTASASQRVGQPV